LESEVHIDKEIREFTKKILSKFQGDIAELCRTDEVIVHFGKLLWTGQQSKLRQGRSQARLKKEEGWAWG
jgi:hypothetical protein